MRTWQQIKDAMPHPEDWTVPGIAQNPAPEATLDERTHDDAVQESLDRRG